MSSTIEKLENNKVKLTIKISPERFAEGLQHAYLENRGKINLQGFRKGKAPRKLIEMQYGKDFFYEDAVNHCLPDAYEDAIEEHGFAPVSRPGIEIKECGEETGALLELEVTVKPEVSIGEYKGISYEKVDSAVTDEELNAEIDKVREKNSRLITVTDRPVQNGDIAVIDFEGFVDGVAFSGGKGEDYELTIGSHTFIDTFEDQIIGANVGDSLDVNVTFPAEYGNKELESKPALFKVSVKGLKYKELPQADDEFAQDVSEFETFDEYKSDLLAKLQVRKEEDTKAEIEKRVLEGLVKVAAMDVPDAMIESEIDEIVENFRRRVQSNGIDFEQYLSYMGMDMPGLRKSYAKNADDNVRTRLALEAVVNKENFEITEEEINAELELIAKAYRMDKEKLESVMGRREKAGIRKDLQVQKALKLVVDSAVAV